MVGSSDRPPQKISRTDQNPPKEPEGAEEVCSNFAQFRTPTLIGGFDIKVRHLGIQSEGSSTDAEVLCFEVSHLLGQGV